MKLLHIDSSILGGNSVSRTISAAIVNRLQAVIPGLEVSYRDLGAAPIAHLSGAYLAGQSDAVQHDQALQEDLSLGGKSMAEFLAADIVVIGSPMYNFTISSQLKAWVDRILVAGKTFRYTENGPEGLAGNKRVIVAASRGGQYGADTPRAAADHQESYLRTVFGFIGVTRLEFILAEGIAFGPEQREKSLAAALEMAGAIQAA